MTSEVRFWRVEALPTSKNEWVKLHWAKRAALKREWVDAIFAAVNSKPRLRRPAIRVAVSARPMWNKRGPLPDFHNLEMLHECVADGLVDCGILKDDSQGSYGAGSIVPVRSELGCTFLRIECFYEGES